MSDPAARSDAPRSDAARSENPARSDSPARAGSWMRTGARIISYAALGLGLGAAAGLLWWLFVDLPVYSVNADGGASTTERGLTQFIAGDAWFCGIGAVVGLMLGLLGWLRFRSLGWPLVLVVTLVALASALVCWEVGYRLGPGEFNPRLAAAGPGDSVPIELTLQARASLATWPFFAIIPVLLGSSLGRDDEEPRPLRRTKQGTS